MPKNQCNGADAVAITVDAKGTVFVATVHDGQLVVRQYDTHLILVKTWSGPV